ncbi:hypothetical protein Tdes44962_MAKER08736 [Teratosphaeria destructans]|uniref:Uncharacterized protein n=1 Tax=Teratosphaeria destructans TaxID=418781 RepID=A0A9W7SVU3_9PEZI|nr:hypothetical protein Tdes44962_MAKER08736 [Teratosphaeria destructans]
MKAFTLSVLALPLLMMGALAVPSAHPEEHRPASEHGRPAYRPEEPHRPEEGKDPAKIERRHDYDGDDDCDDDDDNCNRGGDYDNNGHCVGLLSMCDYQSDCCGGGTTHDCVYGYCALA